MTYQNVVHQIQIGGIQKRPTTLLAQGYNIFFIFSLNHLPLTNHFFTIPIVDQKIITKN